MGTATDTVLLVRCAYCVAGLEFRPLVAYKDGRFVCRNCAHTVRPGVPNYRCTCSTCLSLSRKNGKQLISFAGKPFLNC